MAKNTGTSVMGLSILSALSITGIHSSLNPSLFTLKCFSKKPIEKQYAIEGLWIGLGFGLVGSVAIGIVFNEAVPAVVSGVTAIGLFVLGLNAVNSNGIDNPSMLPDNVPVTAPLQNT